MKVTELQILKINFAKVIYFLIVCYLKRELNSIVFSTTNVQNVMMGISL